MVIASPVDHAGASPDIADTHDTRSSPVIANNFV